MTYDPTHRYLIFSSINYYPEGGWHDLVGSTPTREEARLLGQGTNEWYHVVDRETGDLVENGEFVEEGLPKGRSTRVWRVTTT